VRNALTVADVWDKLETSWVCLDCELMPWSAKAQGLLRQQYAAVAAAGRASLPPAVRALEAAAARGVAIDGLGEAFGERLARVERYAAAYRPYCWPVTSLDDLKLAPFHVLASEGAVHHDRDHAWHMALATRLCEAATGVLTPTRHVTVDLDDEASLAAGTAFWYELTGAGGEGMVVKPSDFVARGASGVIQPAVKCRGPEYLRIIYGPEYDAPGNLERLRSRSLGAKRGLALREFALGLEGLERFVRREPLRHVHECAFAVLALESEPVDPRL
jgi:protein phosphatase